MTLVPAYGRDYKSKNDVLVAWEKNKDFVICDISHPDNGRFTSKVECLRFNITEVTIRYNKNKNVMILKVKQ
jgi:hypothetical protein